MSLISTLILGKLIFQFPRSRTSWVSPTSSTPISSFYDLEFQIIINGIGGSWSEFADYFVNSLKSQDLKLILEAKRNVSNTLSNTHFSTHFISLVKIHIGPTKSIWDPHNLMGPMRFLSIKESVLKSVC